MYMLYVLVLERINASAAAKGQKVIFKEKWISRRKTQRGFFYFFVYTYISDLTLIYL